MSARDSASGSSDWHGGGGSFHNGGGGTANGGVGGGRGGGGYGGGAGYNGGYQSRQGLSTGSTIHGNTAFGRPGGMAQGYATRDARSLAGAGMGPSIGSYGQFMTLQGNPMFSGALGGTSFYGRSAQQALSQAMRQAAQSRVGGLLAGEEVASAPLNRPAVAAPVAPPRVVPAAGPVFNPYEALRAYTSPYGPEAYAGAGRYGQGNFLNAADAYHNWAGTDRGYMSSGNMR